MCLCIYISQGDFQSLLMKLQPVATQERIQIYFRKTHSWILQKIVKSKNYHL